MLEQVMKTCSSQEGFTLKKWRVASHARVATPEHRVECEESSQDSEEDQATETVCDS